MVDYAGAVQINVLDAMQQEIDKLAEANRLKATGITMSNALAIYEQNQRNRSEVASHDDGISKAKADYDKALTKMEDLTYRKNRNSSICKRRHAGRINNKYVAQTVALGKEIQDAGAAYAKTAGAKVKHEQALAKKAEELRVQTENVQKQVFADAKIASDTATNGTLGTETRQSPIKGSAQELKEAQRTAKEYIESLQKMVRKNSELN